MGFEEYRKMGRNPIGKREGRNSWMRKGSVECKKWEGGKEKAIAMGFGFRPNLSLNAATSRINIYEELVGLLSLSLLLLNFRFHGSFNSTFNLSSLPIEFTLFFFFPPFLPSFLFLFILILTFLLLLFAKNVIFFFLI